MYERQSENNKQISTKVNHNQEQILRNIQRRLAKKTNR